MEDLNTHIKKLHEAVATLLKRYKHLLKENESLKNDNETLKKQLNQKDLCLQNEEQKQATKNIALLHTNEERKFLEEKIDFYLRDIEKCLSLLNA